MAVSQVKTEKEAQHPGKEDSPAWLRVKADLGLLSDGHSEKKQERVWAEPWGLNLTSGEWCESGLPSAARPASGLQWSKISQSGFLAGSLAWIQPSRRGTQNCFG